MKIEKAKVTHVTFGNGIIVNQAENSIDVQFEDRKLTMQYPLAFDRFLKFEDMKLQEEIEKEIKELLGEMAAKEGPRLIEMEWPLSMTEERTSEKHAVNKKSEYPRIFEHTLDMCADNDTLRLSIREINRKQRFIPASEDMQAGDPEGMDARKAMVRVSNRRPVEAASSYGDKKVCLLNMASAVNAGGNPKEKTSQEASLCRISTLYKSLATVPCWEQFYKPHRKSNDFLNNDDIIYTPGVIVFKTDSEFPELMPEEDWLTVDILTCAAPKLQKKAKGGVFIYEGHPEGIPKEGLRAVIEKRIERILKVAHMQGAEVLILGAWGCDGDHNDPRMIAAAFKKAIDEYGSWFEAIEFAIPSVPTKTGNLRAFQKAFGLES